MSGPLQRIVLVLRVLHVVVRGPFAVRLVFVAFFFASRGPCARR